MSSKEVHDYMSTLSESKQKEFLNTKLKNSINSPELNYAYLYSVPSPNKFISRDDESSKKKERIDILVSQLFQTLNIDEFEEFYRMIVNHQIKAFERNLRYEPDELYIAISVDAFNRTVDLPKHSKYISRIDKPQESSEEFLAYRMFLAIRQHMNTENNYEYIDTRYLQKMNYESYEMTKERYDIRNTLNNKLINLCYLNSKESDNVSYYSQNQYTKLVTSHFTKAMFFEATYSTTEPVFNIEDYLIANLKKNPDFIVEYPNKDDYLCKRIAHVKRHTFKSDFIKEIIQDMRKIAEKYYEK